MARAADARRVPRPAQGRDRAPVQRRVRQDERRRDLPLPSGGNAPFDSAAKFDSRTGWPSFTKTVTPDAVELLTDRKLGMARTEARCGRCHSHLGHAFDDGPRNDGGQRWCMNSVALDLDPR